MDELRAFCVTPINQLPEDDDDGPDQRVKMMPTTDMVASFHGSRNAGGAHNSRANSPLRWTR